MHDQVPIATLLAERPWLAAAVEAMHTAAVADGTDMPDWFGHLTRATLTPYRSTGAPAPEEAWTLSYPLLGTVEVPNLQGRILGYQTGREYYREPFQGRPAYGLFRPPDCQSADGRYGYGSQQVADCQYCPLRRKHGCRSRGYLLLLTADGPEPVLVLVPPQSLGVIGRSLKALNRYDLALGQWVVTLDTQPYTTRAGRTFPQLHLQQAEGYYSGPGDALTGQTLERLGRRWFHILKRSLIAREQRLREAPLRVAV